jgi:hypothetical protein
MAEGNYEALRSVCLARYGTSEPNAAVRKAAINLGAITAADQTTELNGLVKILSANMGMPANSKTEAHSVMLELTFSMSVWPAP